MRIHGHPQYSRPSIIDHLLPLSDLTHGITPTALRRLARHQRYRSWGRANDLLLIYECLRSNVPSIAPDAP
jgi:hypothetical protein